MQGQGHEMRRQEVGLRFGGIDTSAERRLWLVVERHLLFYLEGSIDRREADTPESGLARTGKISGPRTGVASKLRPL